MTNKEFRAHWVFEFDQGYTATINLTVKIISRAVHWGNFKPLKNVPVISFAGSLNHEKEEVCAGQIYDELEELLPLLEKDRSKLINILYYWHTYHLNNMCPYSKLQYEALCSTNFLGKDYDATLERLTELGLNKEYRYGSQWLYRPVDKYASQWFLAQLGYPVIVERDLDKYLVPAFKNALKYENNEEEVK